MEPIDINFLSIKKIYILLANLIYIQVDFYIVIQKVANLSTNSTHQ